LQIFQKFARGVPAAPRRFAVGKHVIHAGDFSRWRLEDKSSEFAIVAPVFDNDVAKTFPAKGLNFSSRPTAVDSKRALSIIAKRRRVEPSW
jgi:hypothetical protein